MAYAAITALLDGTDHRTPQAKAGIPLTEEALDAAIEQCGRD